MGAAGSATEFEAATSDTAGLDAAWADVAESGTAAGADPGDADTHALQRRLIAKRVILTSRQAKTMTIAAKRISLVDIQRVSSVEPGFASARAAWRRPSEDEECLRLHESCSCSPFADQAE